MRALTILFLVPVLLAGLAGCSGDAFEQYKKDRYVENNPPTPDTTPPDIESVTAIDGTTVQVVFSEPVLSDEAVKASNFFVQGNNRVEVLSSVLMPDNRTVTLSLSNYNIYRMHNGKEYTLLVQNVADASGNRILNAFSTFIGKGRVVADIYNGDSLMPSESPFPSFTSTVLQLRIAGHDVVAYQYSLDDAVWSSEQSTDSVLTLSGLAEGAHTLKVIGKAGATGEWQDSNQATVASFVIDTQPPVALLSRLPASYTADTGIVVMVGGAGVSSYSWRLDAGAWSSYVPAGTAIVAEGLSEGPHILYVLGRDDAGNIQTAATTHSWNINGSDPVAVLLNAPLKHTRVNGINVTVSGSGVSYYRYRLNRGQWSERLDVEEPIVRRNMAEGSYVLEVAGYAGVSEDSAGPTIEHAWDVDVTAPVATLKDLPSSPTSLQRTYIAVGSLSGDAVSYRYKVNEGPLSGVYPVDTPLELTALPEGSYTLKVLAIDAAGNQQSEASAATWTWTVDLTAPYASLSGLPALMTAQKNLYVTVNGVGSVAYKYQLDDQPWSGELSVSVPIDVVNLSDGYHSLSVISRDEAGNWQTIQKASAHNWLVDTIPPSVILTDKPALVTNVQSASIAVGGVGVARYRYRFNGGVWSQEYDRVTHSTIDLSGLAEATHTLSVVGGDVTGNWQAVSDATSYSWTVSLTVPAAVLANKPAAFSTQKIADIDVQSVDAYRYKIDDEPWSAEIPATSNIVLSDLDEGSHVIRVIGKNDTPLIWQSEANATVYEWLVDSVAPTAELANKPALVTNVTSADITVTGIGVYAYRYSLDTAGSYGSEIRIADDNSITLGALSGDTHTLYVIARDEAGNWQSSPTTYTWTVDNSEPVAVLSNTPSDPTNSIALNVTVGGSGVTHYKYRLDGGAWSAVEYDVVTTKITRNGLAAGAHKLEVLGRNAVGTWQHSSITTYEWDIDLVGPTAESIILTNLPDNPTAETSATIGVGGDGIVSYQYRLDDGTWSPVYPISTPISLSGLIDKTYNLYVVARDEAGNWLDRSQAKSYEWRVDTSRPLATITNRPKNPSNLNTADFDIGGVGILLYKYRINGGVWMDNAGAWFDISQNINLSGLGDGNYTIEVCGSRVSNHAAGLMTQADAEATRFSWTVDTAAPTATIIKKASLGSDTEAIFTIGGTDVVAYRYQLDGGTWLPAGTDKNVAFDLVLAGLAPGVTHVLKVIGRDEAGNWQPTASAATHSWYIDYPPLAAPQVADTGTNSSSPILNFSWLNPGGTGTVMIRIATDPGFTTVVHSEVLGTRNYCNFMVTDTEAQQYYAQVRLHAASGAAAGDDNWTSWGASSDGITMVGGITGRVKSGITLAGIAGATVEARSAAGNLLIDTATTDANGDFAFSGIGIGSNYYKLVVNASGYKPTTKNNVSAALGVDTSVGTIYIIPETGVSPGTIKGVMVDGNDGRFLNGGTVTVYDSNGTVVATVATAETAVTGVTFTATNATRDYLTLPAGVAPLIDGGVRLRFTASLPNLLSLNTDYYVSTWNGTSRRATLATSFKDAAKRIAINMCNSNLSGGTGLTLYTSSFTTASLPAGVYTLKLQTPGYYDLTMDNVVVNNNVDINRIPLCPVLVEPQVRVIVRWGSTPTDIDFHVVGPTSRTMGAGTGLNEDPYGAANRFHVGALSSGGWNFNFNEATGYYDRNEPDWTGTASTTALVQDDYTSFGPEAINLTRYGSVQYARGVYTFTARHWDQDTSWYANTTLPVVRIYDSQGMVREIALPNGASTPAGGLDDWNSTWDNRDWKVLKINVLGNTRLKRLIAIPTQNCFFNAGAEDNKAGFDW